METYFDSQAKELRETAKIIAHHVSIANHTDNNSNMKVPDDFKIKFYLIVDNVTLSLMEDKDNFYGYFLFQMSREIRFDISSPTAVNFRGANYTIYFNPLLFLKLSLNQMGSTMKHEILHIISSHLIRARELRGRYSTLAVNMAMDIVVNKYLDYLPPYATTLEWVNYHYALSLDPYQPFEYYVEKLQIALDLLLEEKDELEDDSNPNDATEPEYSAEATHDLWEASDEIDEKTLLEFTEKVTRLSEKGEIPTYLQGILASLRNSKGELPWNLYLNQLMGTVEGNKKKIITRRSRRQPDRLDLKGELRSHKAKIAVAIDISGSISDGEFKQAMKEVLSIVKNYNHEIMMIECDDEIRRVYKVTSEKDIQDRQGTGGGTKFNPVFEYANHNKINLLVYFTDGEGEARLQTPPRGYKILWVISGNGDKLSLKEPYGAVKRLSRIETKDSILDSSDVSGGGYSMNHQE